MSNVFEDFTNQYPLSKTLRFELKPVGKTLEHIENNGILINDKLRADDYLKIKVIINEFHEDFINKSFEKSSISWEALKQGLEVYRKDNSEKNKKELEKLQKQYRTEIVKCFENDKEIYPYLFKKELITKILPEYVKDKDNAEDNINLINGFKNFTTYFDNLHKARKNIYSKDEESTAVSYRLVHENFPKFLANIEIFNKITEAAPEIITATEHELSDLLKGRKLREIFSLEYYNNVLQRSGIDNYNNFISGCSTDDGKPKTKGFNEFINLFIQKNTGIRISKMTFLFKQILSKKEKISFIPEKFESDIEVKSAVNEFCTWLFEEEAIKLGVECIHALKECSTNNVYVNQKELTNLSSVLTGDWSTFNASLHTYAKTLFGDDGKKTTVNRIEKWMKSEQFSIKTINDALSMKGIEARIEDVANIIKEKSDLIIEKHIIAKDYLCNDEQFSGNEKGTEMVKELLDSIMEFLHILKTFDVNNELDRDMNFYSVFDAAFNNIANLIPLYNKVRNYATQKPYSEDKFKLNFECSSLLSGWAKDYETNGALVIERADKYYLCIVRKNLSIEDIKQLKSNYENDPAIRYVYDFQKPDNKNTPRLFIRSKGDSYAPAVEKYNLPINDVIEIYDSGKFKTEYREKNPLEYKKALVSIINYFKLGFSRHESYKHYNFCWKNSDEYNDISEFYNDVISSCYELGIENINFSNLLKLIDDDKIYLFQIYNKDFATGAIGTPNLHTMYWKSLFSPENLQDVVFKLNGEAELFYRNPSIKNPFIHKKGEKLVNKKDVYEKPIPNDIYAELCKYYNGGIELSEKAMKYKELVVVKDVKHEIVKDKRYTVPKFSFHVPITINFKATGSGYINSKVLNAISNNLDVNIIGIDRGERNLIYVSLINQNHDIIDQKSFNIAGDFDYAAKLAQYEENRDKARKNWKEIGTIKELKEGYLSVVIHEITQMMLKNNAIIVMEDLNFGFKRGRFKFERQVYQKFEKMLIDKLNYLADKKKPVSDDGGILKGYQLTEKFESFKKMGKQNGFIFYVPAGYTSKIDPTTGFVSLLNLKWQGFENAQNIISNMDFIRYNCLENYFEFGIDYDKLKTAQTDYTKKWTVCTFGDRYVHIKDKTTNIYKEEKINLTSKLKSILEKHSVNYSKGEDVKEVLCKSSSKELLESVLYVLKLAMQMRSTSSADDVDMIISPVKNQSNKFFVSGEDSNLPIDADANGAYHIALKGHMYMKRIKDGKIEGFDKGMSTYEWLKFMQCKETEI